MSCWCLLCSKSLYSTCGIPLCPLGLVFKSRDGHSDWPPIEGGLGCDVTSLNVYAACPYTVALRTVPLVVNPSLQWEDWITPNYSREQINSVFSYILLRGIKLSLTGVGCRLRRMYPKPKILHRLGGDWDVTGLYARDASTCGNHVVMRFVRENYYSPSPMAPRGCLVVFAYPPCTQNGALGSRRRLIVLMSGCHI